MTFKVGDIVVMKETREVSPLCRVKAGQIGVVKDVTCPEYYLVDFGNYLIKWVSINYLKLK